MHSDTEAPPRADATGADPSPTPDPGDGSEPLAPAEVAAAEIADLKGEVLRRRAEFDNFRRRVDRDQRLAVEDGIAGVLAEILPPIDALDIALSSAGARDDVRRGVEIAVRDLRTALTQRGISVEDPVGQLFDPARHQALSYEAVDGFADGVVSACYRKGYRLGDRLIRPALVQVARAAEPAGDLRPFDAAGSGGEQTETPSAPAPAPHAN